MKKDAVTTLIIILYIMVFICGMFCGKALIKKSVVDFDERVLHRNLHTEYDYNYCPYCGECIKNIDE